MSGFAKFGCQFLGNKGSKNFKDSMSVEILLNSNTSTLKNHTWVYKNTKETKIDYVHIWWQQLAIGCE